MKILYICNHDPFKTTGGGSMASHAYLRAFCDYANGNLDLICSSSVIENKDPNIRMSKIIRVQDRSILDKFKSVFNGYLCRYIEFTKKYLRCNIGVYNLVVFDHNCISGPLVKFVDSMGIKTITIHHNYEKEYFEDNNHGLYKFFFLHHVVKWEKNAYLNSSINLFLTSQDKDTFAQVYGYNKGKNYIIGAFEYQDYEEISSDYLKVKHPLTFAITGSLSAYQTNDAIQYFFDELYQCLSNDCRVIIAGRNPTEKIKELCNKYPNVVLIPNPENMNDVLADADIYVCATRIGGGLKLRVMDGLKNGLPVITHVCSARGFDSFYGLDVFKIYSTQREFIDAVDSIERKIKQGSLDRNVVKQIYRDNFSYETGFKRIKDILSEI